jgi:hypothetical protein
MTSTNRTTIAKRVGQCLVASALMAGIAFGATPIAGAKPKLDWNAYQKCINDFVRKHPDLPTIQFNNRAQQCCELNGGVWKRIGNPANFDNSGSCGEPAPEAENVPQPPGSTEPPPVLQDPPSQPSNPLIPVPRGSNSGTLG